MTGSVTGTPPNPAPRSRSGGGFRSARPEGRRDLSPHTCPGPLLVGPPRALSCDHRAAHGPHRGAGPCTAPPRMSELILEGFIGAMPYPRNPEGLSCRVARRDPARALRLGPSAPNGKEGVVGSRPTLGFSVSVPPPRRRGRHGNAALVSTSRGVSGLPRGSAQCAFSGRQRASSPSRARSARACPRRRCPRRPS